MARVHIGMCSIVAALGLTGCSDDDAAVGQRISIAWISKGATNSIFEPGRAGAKDAGDHLSLASGKAVDVLLVEPDLLRQSVAVRCS